jgi:hypothetical protein
MAKTGDCVVKHPGGFATGMALVVRIVTECGSLVQPLFADMFGT